MQIDPEYKCQQVNLVTKRCPGVPDEQEYLFAPYSVFKVASADYSGDGSDDQPYQITLETAADNQAEREDLPLAPWS